MRATLSRTVARLLAVLPVLLTGAQPVAPVAGAHEEQLPPNAVARIGTTRLRHGGQVGSVAFSPDGKRIVSTDWHSVGVWDTRSGQELAFRMLREQYRCWPQLSSDGSLIACRVKGGALGVQEAETGKERSRFPNSKDGRVHNLLFSQDNRWLTSTDDEGIVSLWDVTAGKLAWSKQSPQKGYQSGQAFTPDGKQVMHATHEGHLFLWDVQTGKELWHVEPGNDKEREYYFNGIDISPDGEVAAVMHRWARIELREVKTGRLRREFESRGSWSGPQFSPDGKLLLCGTHNSADTILFWDVATGKLARKVQGDPSADASSFATSADGKCLAVGGHDYAVHLWDLATGKDLFPPAHPGGDVSASLLADGKTVLTTCRYWGHVRSGTVDPQLGFWDLKGKALKHTKFDAKDAHAFALAPGATVFAAAEGFPFMRYNRVWKNGELQCSVRLADLATGKELQRIENMRCELHDLEFSPDGRFLFTSVDNPGPNADNYHREPVVQVWKRTRTGLEKTAEIASIGAFSSRFVCAPDSRWIGVATGTGFDVHDCDTGKLLRRCEPLAGAVRAVSPSGRVLACTDDDKRTAFLVELATGKTVCKLECDPAYLVRPCFAFSPDGRIVAGDLNSETIVLWDAFTGKRVGKFEGHRGHVVSLCFTPDGKFLVSGSSDTTVLIWDYRQTLPKGAGKPEERSARRLEKLWGDLQAEEAERGSRAISALVRSHEPAIAFLRKKVAPATADEQRQLQTWIEDVGKGNETVRERALTELTELGALAEPAIQQALRGNPSVEVKRRLEKLLGTASTAPTPVWLATQRTMETLELIGTPEARTVLEELSKGIPESPRTQEASRTLERFRKREAAAKP